MNATTKHTPTPWKLEPDGMAIVADYNCEPTICVFDEGPEIVEECPNWQENGLFIVTAVNSHAALLAACQSALAIIKAFDMGRYPPANTRDVIQQLEAALQLGKGEQ